MRILLLLLLSTSVFATEVTKEGTLVKSGDEWSAEGFDGVDVQADQILIKDPFYQTMNAQFDKSGVGGGMGARFEGFEILKDAGMSYTFKISKEDLFVYFLSKDKKVNPNSIPDLDAKVVLFSTFDDGKTQASNTEAVNITAPVKPKSSGGGCASTGSTPVLLLGIMAALLMRKYGRKINQRT